MVHVYNFWSFLGKGRLVPKVLTIRVEVFAPDQQTADALLKAALTIHSPKGFREQGSFIERVIDLEEVEP